MPVIEQIAPVFSTNPPSVTIAPEPLNPRSTPTIGELQKVHPHYRRDLLDEYELWYEGGHRFREALEADAGTFLCRRRSDDEILDDKSDSIRRKKTTYRDLRKTRAQYTSELGRIINSLVASAHKNPLRIVADGSDADYYQSLNADIDGAGTDASTQAARIMREGLLNRRAYLGVSFAGTALPGMDLEQALDAGILDAKLLTYNACNVIDWHRDGNGRLDMVRIYSSTELKKYGTWGTLLGITHQWTVVDDVDVSVYTFFQPATNGIPTPIDAAQPARLISMEAHGMDRCPVLEWTFGRDYWVADRLVEAQKKLFNSEADEAHIRSEAAHPQRWLAGMPIQNTDSDGKLLATAVHGIVMEPGGSFHIDGPSADQSEWHFKAIEVERAGMYSAMESLYLGQSQQSQNARQAAAAKAIDREDSTLFIAFAAASLAEMYETALKLVQSKRGDSTIISIQGMDKIDSKPLQDAIAEVQQLSMLPRIPDEAYEFVIRRLASKLCQEIGRAHV
jgi:hypothetical protein